MPDHQVVVAVVVADDVPFGVAQERNGDEDYIQD
jgi:hypothetical protein